ncbi:Protein TOS1 [Hanseniaspora osmophila]|uniref:glucan endo-1,3-beta-D-glucosidase n=1 Tax=Hanseniaspora osmophila TaxID=56408 RepID=A0A1E5R960_9ASCO|nr:Protein TOS1 [Hanseniaspora osmophila]
MKFSNVAKLSAVMLVSQKVVADDCQYVSGNYYCSEVEAVVYNNVGYSGSYSDVTSMDESSCVCSQSSTSFSGTNAPLDEELSVHFRGPINLKQFGVYSLSSSSSSSKKKRDSNDANHKHGNLEERAVVVDVVEVYSTVFVDSDGNTVTPTETSTVASTEDATVAAATTASTASLLDENEVQGSSQLTTTIVQVDTSSVSDTPATETEASSTSSISVELTNYAANVVVSTTTTSSSSENYTPTTTVITPSSTSSTEESSTSSTEESSTTSTEESSTSSTEKSSTSSSTSTSSSAAATTSSSSSGSWSRSAYYEAGSSADNVVFMNYYGGSGSGVWSSCFGNSISYCNSDASAGSSSAVALSDVTVESDTEFMIFSGESCGSSSDCGYYRSGIPAYHGFGGASKIFVFEFGMPTSTKSSSSNNDMPAIWMLNAKIPRTLQYGNADCSCWSTGCGELDLFEILSSGSDKLISHIHDGQGKDGSSYGGGGSQDYFTRPTSGTMKAAVIFDSDSSIHIVQLDDSVTFGSSLDDSTVEEWLNKSGASATLS